MKCKNYLDIRIEPIRPSFRVDVQKEIVSFDTETRNGKPFLMCDSIGNVLTDQDSMINHLLTFKDTLNTFYNLSYDKNDRLCYINGHFYLNVLLNALNMLIIKQRITQIIN